jgi:DNA-binding XRE family transcriptional regulator
LEADENKRQRSEAMIRKKSSHKVDLTPQQRAEHRCIRSLFQNWHPSPEELIASGEGVGFSLIGEYPYLRPFLVRLKNVRQRAGLSLADVARRCSIDKAALSRLENGQNSNPTLDTLWRYAAALGRRLELNTSVISSTRPSTMNNGKSAQPHRKKFDRE